MMAGPAMALYAKNARSAAAVPAGGARPGQDSTGTTGSSDPQDGRQGEPLRIARELGDVMTENVTVVRDNDKLRKTLEKLDELRSAGRRTSTSSTPAQTINQSLAFVNQLWNMLELARVITKGALLRDESRGAHYKPEFSLPRAQDARPQATTPSGWRCWKANTEKWRKTTMARYTAEGPGDHLPRHPHARCSRPSPASTPSAGRTSHMANHSERQAREPGRHAAHPTSSSA